MNEDRKQPNNVFLILSGLSPVNDKINIISDRIDEIEEKQKIHESEDALSALELSKLSEKISDKEKVIEEKSVDMNAIFNKFI